MRQNVLSAAVVIGALKVGAWYMSQTKADSVNSDLRICTVFYLWFGNLFDHHDELKNITGANPKFWKGESCV